MDFGLILLGAIILLLAGLLAVAVAEFVAIFKNKNPYTFYGRVLVAQYPVIAVGLAVISAGAIGWLTGHLFGGCF